MIRDLKAEQLINPIIDSISKAFVIRRIDKIEGSEIKEMALIVCKTLKESFTTYRIQEVCKAIELGASGELSQDNDMTTVSAELCFKWSHRYRESISTNALWKQRQYEEKQAKETSEKEKEESIKKLNAEIAEAYKFYCDNFEMPELSLGLRATYCRTLYAKNLAELSAEQEKEIFDKAKAQVPQEINLLPMNDVDRIFNNKKKSAHIQELAESIALEYIFAEYLKNDIKLI